MANKLIDLYPKKELQIKVNKKRNDQRYIISKILRGFPNIKAVENVGWKLKISIEEGFKRTIESFK